MASGILEFDAGQLAEARRQYEETDVPLACIAESLGCSKTTLLRRIAEWGWGARPVKATQPAGSGLESGAAKPLAASATGKKPARGKGAKRRKRPTARKPPQSAMAAKDRNAEDARAAQANENDTQAPEHSAAMPATRAALIARMQLSIERELGAIEAIVGRLGSGGANPAHAERAARTLASLVRTLHELTRLDADRTANAGDSGGSGPAGETQDDDAVPRDLDELRRELARRIDLLRQRRIADGAAGADDA